MPQFLLTRAGSALKLVFFLIDRFTEANSKEWEQPGNTIGLEYTCPIQVKIYHILPKIAIFPLLYKQEG